MTWDPSLIAAPIGGFGGFLFMSKRKGRSGGFFGGRTQLSSDPSSHFFLGYLLMALGEEGAEFCLFIAWDVVVCHVADCS